MEQINRGRGTGTSSLGEGGDGGEEGEVIKGKPAHFDDYEEGGLNLPLKTSLKITIINL